jgi:hypothetical protein
MPVIPAFGKLRQEEHKFNTSLGYQQNKYAKKPQRHTWALNYKWQKLERLHSKCEALSLNPSTAKK